MPKARSLQPKSYTFGSKAFWFGRSGEVVDCVVVTIGAEVSENGTAAGVDSEISDVLLPPPQADIATRKMIDVTSNSIGFIHMLMVQGVQVANRLFMSYVQHPKYRLLEHDNKVFVYRTVSRPVLQSNQSKACGHKFIHDPNRCRYPQKLQVKPLASSLRQQLFLADYARFGITHCR